MMTRTKLRRLFRRQIAHARQLGHCACASCDRARWANDFARRGRVPRIQAIYLAEMRRAAAANLRRTLGQSGAAALAAE